MDTYILAISAEQITNYVNLGMLGIIALGFFDV